MDRLDIIVLGEFIKNFDARYNPLLIPATYKSRLDRTVEIYRRHVPRPRILISGEDPADLAMSEAQIGLNYLLTVYGDHIHTLTRDVVLEEQAQSTTGNAVYTKRILLKIGSTRQIVVSSDFHMGKVEPIFRFVYGPELEPEFIGANSRFTRDKLARLALRYRKDGEEELKWFEQEGIKPGEHEKIIELIKWTGHLSG